MSIKTKHRECFEDYVKKHGYLSELGLSMCDSDMYDDPEVDLAWETWSNLMDRLVIELPSSPVPTGGRESYSPIQNAYWMGMLSVIHAIESAGLKVKL